MLTKLHHYLITHDRRLTLAFNKRRSRLSDFLMLAFTRLGDGYGGFLFGLAIYLFDKETRRTALPQVGLAFLLVVILYRTLKRKFRRRRPYSALKDSINSPLKLKDEFSWPSGHSGTAFVAATTAAHFYSLEVAIPVLITAVLIAFSRVYLGVHYVSDVIAGGIMGILCSELTYRFMIAMMP